MPTPDKLSWSGLSLAAKGLILFSIPLCLQLAFGLVLIQLHKEAETEAQRANEARLIAGEVHGLLSDIFELSTFPVTFQPQWKFQGYASFMSPRYTTITHRISKRYEILDKLTQKYPELNKPVNSSFKPYNEALKVMDGTRSEILAGHLDSVVATSGAKSRQIEALAQDFISQELMILAKNEEELVNSSNKKQADIRQRTVKYAFALILANIFFLVLLAKFLVQTIIARLGLIADNAVRLAAHQPLHPSLAGGDEIAELDHVFHNMAATIDQSAQARQDLYNMVTHDLRTPLAAIQGCLEMLALGLLDEFNTHGKKLIRIAVRNSSLTMALVNDLLDSQKVEAGMLELNATTLYLEDVFESVSLDISGWVDEYGIQISFPITDIKVKANQDMLGRVIFNLISNAMKYSPRNSTISVNVTTASNMAEITVTDQGPGIPKHMIKGTFQRLRPVAGSDPDSAVRSTLALSICHDFVNLHGGKIWATNNPDLGSTFHFTVPLA
jgi:signal transduction histidine kinase